MKGGTMKDRKIPRRLSRWALALAVTAIAAPAAEARHAPPEPQLGTSPPMVVDAATRHHHPDVVQPPTRIVTISKADSFDWIDASIGASGTFGVALLVGGSALLLRRNKRGATSTHRRRGVPVV
jgi:hypothetical protein